MIDLSILTPDVSATVRVDLRRVKLESDKIILREVQGVDSLRDKGLRDIDEAIAGLDGAGPTVTIGYLPAAKKTSLSHRLYALQRSQQGEWSSDALDEGTEISREWLRWGLRGHSLAVPFATEEVEYRGAKVAVAAASMVDLYERNGLLFALRRCVEEYNDLSAEKKTQSLLNAGIVRETSVATSAIKSQS